MILRIIVISFCSFILACNQNGTVGLEPGKNFNSLSTDDAVIQDPDSRYSSGDIDREGSSNLDLISTDDFCNDNLVFEKAVLESQNEGQFIGIGHSMYIPEPLNRVTVLGISGNIMFASINELNSAKSISGNLSANVKNVGLISSVSGSVCLKAETIQKIHSISGPSKIVANSIEELQSISGEIHIYKATVKNLLANSGHICLHEGAKIENVVANSGSIQNCN